MNDAAIKYNVQPIAEDILSTYDITADGKVISADIWNALWGLVIGRVNEINEFCANIDSLRIDWQQSVKDLNLIETLFQEKYDALAGGFMHYGAEPPTNPHIRFWVQPSSNINLAQLVTYAELNSTLNKTVAPVAQAVETKAAREYVDASFANALTDTVSDTVVVVDDVSPVQHNLAVKVKSNVSGADLSSIEVTKFGKNLFNINAPMHSGGSTIVSQGADTIKIKHTGTYKWLSVNFAVPKALAGKTVTISADISTSGINTASIRLMWVDSAGAAAGSHILMSPYVTGNKHMTATGVVPEQPDASHDTLCMMLYSNIDATLTSGVEYTATFSNVQLELGTTETVYESFKPAQTLRANSSGVVTGLTSVAKNMILLSNNKDVTISLTYNRDVNIALQQLINRFIPKITSVTLLASKWDGESSPYSQIINIAEVTPNSKIDLNPTVTQLDTFHDKDLSFVVENDNGVVTVYCVGQKPTSNYTIQASITEVFINE